LSFRVAGALDGLVQGYAGTTPYIRFGNAPALLASALLLAAAVLAGRRLRH
jgi:apolipoprotein N-acyltransferase